MNTARVLVLVKDQDLNLILGQNIELNLHLCHRDCEKFLLNVRGGKNLGSEKTMVNRALIIGINYENTDLQLSGCINDALNLKNYLITKGFTESNMQFLTDQTVLPTRANILAAISWLTAGAKAGDSLWFSYSGHGSQQSERSQRVRDEKDGLDETIVPLDYQTAGQILDDDLRRLLVDPLPAGVRLTALIDACHSATSFDLAYQWEDASIYRKRGKALSYVAADWRTSTRVTINSQYRSSAADVVTISGSRDNQTSADAVEEGKATGAMTYSFLKTLASAEKSKSVLSWQDLLKGMTCLLRIKGYSQVPNMASGRSLNLADPVKL